MNQKKATLVAVMAIGLMSWSTTAAAQNAVGIGGRMSITANFAVQSTRPDDSDFDADNVLLGASGAYTTESARYEFGGGILIAGQFTDSSEFSFYSFVGEGRINTNALGPDENVLLYVGAIAGLSIVEFKIDVPGGSDITVTDELFVIGPKIGAEIYVTPNIAVQLQDALLADSDGGFTNNLTIGFKFVFQ